MRHLRFSFPQLLLVAFVLIGALLGTAALRALFTLDTLMAQSRESAAQAALRRSEAAYCDCARAQYAAGCHAL